MRYEQVLASACECTTNVFRQHIALMDMKQKIKEARAAAIASTNKVTRTIASCSYRHPNPLTVQSTTSWPDPKPKHNRNPNRNATKGIR